MLVRSVLAVADVADPIIDGEWSQGSILRGKLSAGSDLRFLNREVPVMPSGEFVIGLGRDFPSRAELTVISAEGERKDFIYSVTSREYQTQKVTGVPAKTVNPSAEYLSRIRKEAAEVATARKVLTTRQDFRSSFDWPLIGPITGVYGSQRFYNGVPKRPHYGVDVAAPTGTKVKAPAGGVVILANKDMFFSGGTLIIDHGYGLSSTFMHLSKILVVANQEVRQGDLIAEVGATGRATGPHLDWRMNWFDQRVDPTFLVPPMSLMLTGQEDKVADKSTSVQ